MFSTDLSTYGIGILSILLGALGLYTRGQYYKIKSLDSEKKEAEGQVVAAKKVAIVQQAKAEMHKDVARTIVKNNNITKEKVKRIQEKIDAVQNGETFTLVI
jgi:hypothetical protein